MTFTYLDVAKMIDHSLLNPTLTVDDLEAGCRLAVAYDAASVCIMPYYLKLCAELLAGSTVKASTTVGFPHGGHTTATKLFETQQALADGGQELDMVVNISQVLSGNWDYVRNDIRVVAEATHAAGQKVKVIFENSYLKDEHKIRLCEICGELGVDWVKTSTGYGSSGATTFEPFGDRSRELCPGRGILTRHCTDRIEPFHKEVPHDITDYKSPQISSRIVVA
jgi:deoxyribose-phosphate aldolase